MRHPALLALVLVGLFLCPSAVRADEGDEVEEVEVPEYSAEDMVFAPDDLPEGWKICPASIEPPAGAPTEDLLMQMGEVVGLDEDTLYVESRTIQNGDKIVVVSLVDIDTNPEAFQKVLAAKVTEASWVLVDLGSPMRPLVVSAADAESANEIAAWQRETAVRKLADAALKKLELRTREGFESGQTLLKAAAAIEPKAGVVAVIAGMLEQDQGRKLSLWAHAIAADTPIPPTGAMRAQLALSVGIALYQTHNPEYAAKALESLTIAVASLAGVEGADRPRLGGDIGGRILAESGSGAIPADPTLPLAQEALQDAVDHESALDVKPGSDDVIAAFGSRYNLSCAHARLGQLEEAFAELEKSLEIAKTNMSAREYGSHYNHARTIDPDMASLRESAERFAAVMEKFAPPAGSDG